jgi:branched-chain amino acid transport system permease protein
VLLVDLALYRLLAYGIVALLIMLTFPDGLVGGVENALRRYRLRRQIEGVSTQPVLAASGLPPLRRVGTATAVELHAARKAYGRMVALDDVTLAIAPGHVHGLVGPNGSGKTTLLNAISGLIRLDQGGITINGTPTTGLPAHAIARLGVGRTFQTPRVFEDMSIWDNLRIGADAGQSPAASWVLSALEQQRPDWQAQLPDLVPHAQRRLLEVLRVTASQPGILLLDEPAAGLSPEERRNFVALLRVLRDRLGMTIVLIEHDLKLVWQIADRITVLDAGRIVADGAPQEIMRNPRVRGLFTGTTQDA